MQFQVIVLLLVALTFLLREERRRGQKELAEVLRRRIVCLEQETEKLQGEVKRLGARTAAKVDMRAGRLEYQIASRPAATSGSEGDQAPLATSSIQVSPQSARPSLRT